MLVDVSIPQWTVLYTNDAFTAVSGELQGTEHSPVCLCCGLLVRVRFLCLRAACCASSAGVSRHQAVAQSFWELFSAQGMSADSFASECDASEPFTLVVGVQTNAGQRHSPKLAIIDFRCGTLPWYLCKCILCSVMLCAIHIMLCAEAPCRPGSTGQLGGHSQSVGIPATAPLSASKTSRQSATPRSVHLRCKQYVVPFLGGVTTIEWLAATCRYYFGILRMDTASKQAASPSAVASPVQPLAQLEPATQNAADRCNTRASLDSQRSHTGLASFKRAMPSAFTDVRLGPLIGRGAYGRVRAVQGHERLVGCVIGRSRQGLG